MKSNEKKLNGAVEKYFSFLFLLVCEIVGEN